MVAESFLFSRTFEIILIAILIVVTVMLFTGHGSVFLKSKGSTRKLTPEEEKIMGRKLGCVTLLWLLAEFLLVLFGQYVWVTVAYMVIIAVSLVFLIKFFKRNS
ncbi:MAG: hypothetical protein ACOX8E_11910 [Ruminococcus sp.]|jgi:hypothetical protein